MNQLFLQHKISGLLQEMQVLLAASNNSAIEMELLKQKCISVYEQILQWQSLQIKPIESALLDEPKIDTLKPLVEAQVPAHPETMPSPPTAEVPATDQKNTAPVKEEEKTNQIREEVRTVNTPGDEISIHKKMSTAIGNQHELNKNIRAKGESIKSVISLNQKISFVNVLFGENTVEYAKAVDKLNEAKNLDEALGYFSEMKRNYNWDKDNPTVNELQQLIEKRFA